MGPNTNVGSVLSPNAKELLWSSIQGRYRNYVPPRHLPETYTASCLTKQAKFVGAGHKKTEMIVTATLEPNFLNEHSRKIEVHSSSPQKNRSIKLQKTNSNLCKYVNSRRLWFGPMISFKFNSKLLTDRQLLDVPWIQLSLFLLFWLVGIV